MCYGSDMRCGTWILALGCSLLGFGQAGRAATAEESPAAAATPAAPTNSYIVITNRNAFGIKPPPLPPEPAPVVPATPPPNLFLTGMSLLNGAKRAYLVVNKAGGKQPEYLSVEEGYDSDGLQVLAIDTAKQVVKVRNAGTEVALNFKDNAMKQNGVPVPGGPPGMPNVRGVPPPPGGYNPVPQPVAQAAAPTIIGRGGAVADNAPAPAAAVLDGLAAGNEAVAPRQLPARRAGGVYLGAGGGAATTVNGDATAASNLPVAPTRPGQVTGGGSRPPTVIPPVPVIPGQ